jgi:hypothetical protein
MAGERSTVSLDAAAYQKLVQFAGQLQSRLGRPVSLSEAVLALLDERRAA